MHGGAVTIGLYRRLAAALADRFTVHLYNRRGYGDAPPRLSPYTMDQDVDDLAAVLQETGARNVIGHSGGGYIALRAALRLLPIDRLALYDPAVNVGGAFPSAWLPAAHAAVARGDIARGLAVVSNGINTQSGLARLPLGVSAAITKLFLRTPIGRTMGDLLPTTLAESAEIAGDNAPASHWSGIKSEVLLAYGQSGPPYYAPICTDLAAALPRARALRIPHSGHDGINRAPRRLTDPLAAFFAGS